MTKPIDMVRALLNERATIRARDAEIVAELGEIEGVFAETKLNPDTAGMSSRDKILSVLQSAGMMRATRVSALSGVNKAYTFAILGRLTDDGKVVRVHRGTYRLAEAA